MVYSRERLGGRPVTTLPLSLNEQFVAEAFKGEDFSKYRTALKEIAGGLYQLAHGLTPHQTVAEVEDYLNRPGASIVLVRPRVLENAAYVGLGMQYPIRADDGSGGELKVSYFGRAISPAFQQMKIGPFLVQAIKWLHEPDILAAKSQNPAAISSLIPAPNISEQSIFVDSTMYPFDRRYDDVSPEAVQMRQIMLQVAKRSGKHTEEVNPDTGVLKYVYPEGRARGFDPNKASSRVMALYERMQKEFGLVPDDGDAIFYMGWTSNRRRLIRAAA